MKTMVEHVEIEFIKGNIAYQPGIEAVVNAANARLTTGGGVAGALHDAAGPELYKACKPMAPINPGEAVISPAFKLPNKYVIHCLGPVYGQDKPEDKLLKNCYKNSFRLIAENQIKSVVLPAISTGAFGYPIVEATQIALSTTLAEISSQKQLQKVKFVLYSEGDLKIYESLFRQICSNK